MTVNSGDIMTSQVQILAAMGQDRTQGFEHGVHYIVNCAATMLQNLLVHLLNIGEGVE